MVEMEELSLRQYIRTLLRWWPLILLVPAVAGASGYFFVKEQGREETYVATTEVTVGNPVAAVSDPDLARSAQLMVPTYLDIAESDAFLRDVNKAAALGLNESELSDRVDVTAREGSLQIEIRARGPTRDKAVLLANKTAEELAARGKPALPADATDPAPLQAEATELATRIAAAEAEVERLTTTYAGANSWDEVTRGALAEQIGIVQGNIRMWRARQDAVLRELARLEELTKSAPVAALTIGAPAASADLRSKDSPIRSGVVAGAAGLLAAIALAFMFDYLDDRLRTQEDVERTLGLPVLGVVRRSGFGFRRGHNSRDRNSASGQWLSGLTKAQSKRYQEVSDRLLKSMAGASPRVLAVAGLGNGTDDTALALAQACAAVGESTVLVRDGGRRSGPAAGDSAEAKGLGTLLTTESNPSQGLQATPIPGLSVVPYDLSHSAFKRPNLLPRLKRAFSQLAAMSDLVIVDVPTVTEDPSALLIAGASDAALLVVEAGRTTAGSARGVVDHVAALGGRVLGVVLSRGRGQGRVLLGALPVTAAHKAPGPGQLQEVKG